MASLQPLAAQPPTSSAVSESARSAIPPEVLNITLTDMLADSPPGLGQSPVESAGGAVFEAEEGLEGASGERRNGVASPVRIQLELGDLFNGMRILLIEDTHLRAGTLYLGKCKLSASRLTAGAFIA